MTFRGFSIFEKPKVFENRALGLVCFYFLLASTS